MLGALFCGLFFVRFTNISGEISYDFDAYIAIFRSFDIIGFNYTYWWEFPYVYAQDVVPIEFGFFFIYKAVDYISNDPVLSFVIIGTASIFLRVYVLHLLGVPTYAKILLIAITAALFEMNALRLGVASSLMLFGLYLLTKGRIWYSILAFAAATSCHLQVLIFIIPCLMFYFFSSWITASKIRLIFFFAVSTLFSLSIPLILPAVGNAKLQIYLNAGGSSSAGLTLTSLLAALFVVANILEIPRSISADERIRIWSSIVAASLPSIVMLILLTDIAVVGDRAWQLAYSTITPFYFYFWGDKARALRRPSAALLLFLTLVIATNVLIRFPISSLFTPVLPGL